MIDIVVSLHNTPLLMAITVTYWVLTSFVVGYFASKISLKRLSLWERSYRIYPFELRGLLYERYLFIRKWKRYLPEAGDMFKGGVSKRSLDFGASNAKVRFYLETKRAEFTHRYLIIFQLLPVFFWYSFFHEVVVAYALLANTPCLIAQRYNRARLERLNPMIKEDGKTLAVSDEKT